MPVRKGRNHGNKRSPKHLKANKEFLKKLKHKSVIDNTSIRDDSDWKSGPTNAF